jgi:hypothetical protein
MSYGYDSMYDEVEENTEYEFTYFTEHVHEFRESSKLAEYFKSQPREKKVGYILMSKYDNVSNIMQMYPKMVSYRVCIEGRNITYWDESDLSMKTLTLREFLLDNLYGIMLRENVEEEILKNKLVITRDVYRLKKLVCFAFIPRGAPL